MNQRAGNNHELPLQRNGSGQQSEAIRLIVGLGNPGREYEGTRHNIGFTILDALAHRHGVNFSFESKWNAQIAKIKPSSSQGIELVLMKPMTFMNLSGAAVSTYTRFFHYSAAESLVVLDDVALPLGTVRFRRSGSAGGQRGLESILTHFSTEAVPRLRIGVGAGLETSKSLESPEVPLSDYVLSRFRKEEQSLVQETVDRAVEAIECCQRENLETAMNFYNTTPTNL